MELLLLVILAAVPVFTDAASTGVKMSRIPETSFLYSNYEIPESVTVPADEDLSENRKGDRIIGGVPATIEEFPFLVSLYADVLLQGGLKLWNDTILMKITPFICGGTIITEDWVLTAAHCVQFENASNVDMDKLRGGSTYAYRGGVMRRVANIVAHKFRPHDIALVKVDEPWPLNGVTISLARLPRQDDPIPVGSPATTMGWGMTEKEGKLPVTLMKHEAVVISHIFCWVSWIWLFAFINDQQLCTTFHPGKMPSYAWKGDSGGPVLVNGEVVGINSFAATIGLIPDVHTRVSSYIDWIEETVGPLPRNDTDL